MWDIGEAAGIRGIVLSSSDREAEFTEFMRNKVFTSVDIVRRTVRGTKHLLLKGDSTIDGRTVYLWLTFAELVGATPELAGEGATVLTSGPSLTPELSNELASYGALITFAATGEAAEV